MIKVRQRSVLPDFLLSQTRMKTLKYTVFFLVVIFLFASCTVLARYVKYGSEDIDDYRIFPTYPFQENTHKFYFDKYADNRLDTLQSLLEKTSTRAFIVIRNDSVLYEKYFRNYRKEDISTVFSVSKSVTSLLVGIALDEGHIKDVNEPVTNYIGELNNVNPDFKKLTIRHLLDMRTGIRFDENSRKIRNPMARLYYGKNQMDVIKKLKFEAEPGTKHEYQSISTAILGIVLERATGKNLAQYFEEKVWIPLGMENRGSWSLDTENGSAKAFGGLNISAIDLAKIGKLYVNKGKFGHRQIVSEKWIAESLTPNTSNDGYQNQWYSDFAAVRDEVGNRYFKDSTTVMDIWKEKYQKRYPVFSLYKTSPKGFRKEYVEKYMWPDEDEYRWLMNIYTGQFYALGIFKQLLYIDPAKKIVIVRLGDNNDYEYEKLMYEIAQRL